jgi:CubicO group peptidase (beta-lactamase class C family)
MLNCFGINAAALLLATSVAAAQENLDATADRAMRMFEVPGIAIAIVKDGRVVLQKGYGVRKLGEPAKVTPQSLFRIGSNTKAFTTAALAMLVDEGKLRWDDRVVDHMPSFQMSDPYVTREMTIRDLLTHRSGLGLGAGDLMFWPATDFTQDEIIRRIRFLQPASSFRSRYAYDNLLYLVAGHIIPIITGKTWDDFVRERIFTPLGMAHTSASTKMLMAAADVATPHARADGKLVALPQTDHDNNAPAGAINSCVEDLAKWMILQLSRGGKLFSEAQSKEMWSPQTILPIEEATGVFAEVQPNFRAYGLGWILQDYRGRKMVYHTGTLAGYVSRTTLVPELNLGVVVLTNAEQEGAHQAIAYSIVDQYLGVAPVDWVTAAHSKAAEAESKAAQSVGQRHTKSRPSLPLASYAGTYRDPWYGYVNVEHGAGKLTISFTHTKQLSGDLEHWQYDTFVARWRDRTLNADAYVTFALNPDGSIESAKMQPVSPLTDFSFDFQDLALRRVSGKRSESGPARP